MAETCRMALNHGDWKFSRNDAHAAAMLALLILLFLTLGVGCFAAEIEGRHHAGAKPDFYFVAGTRPS